MKMKFPLFWERRNEGSARVERKNQLSSTVCKNGEDGRKRKPSLLACAVHSSSPHNITSSGAERHRQHPVFRCRCTSLVV